MQPQTFVFFGIVGSGKGTQAKLLMDFLKKKSGQEPVYAGTGEGFRKLLESGTYASSLVKESMIGGELITDFLATSIFTNILISSLTPEKHLFADGYPRTTAQSKDFRAMMKFFKRDQIKIIYIEVEKEEAIKRNLLRGRHDDTKKGLAKRFDEYTRNVIPAMNYFKNKKNYKIYTVNGEQSIQSVHQDIIRALNL